MSIGFDRVSSLPALSLLCALGNVAALAEVPPSPRFGTAVESFIPTGYSPIAQEQADFNGDGRLDVVLVVASKADPDADRPLLILFRRPSGGFVLSHRSDRAIPERATGGIASPDGFAGLRVERNTFLIAEYGGSSVRSSTRWRFRFQDGDWFLIGETLRLDGAGVECLNPKLAGDRECLGYQIDTNFLTGRQIIKHDYHDLAADQDRTQMIRRTVRVEKLVRLVDFEPRPWAAIPQ